MSSNNPIQAGEPERQNEKQDFLRNVATSSQVDHLIEQLKLRTGELEEANRELRRVSHYRSLFLARMSHELRTPLTSILGFSEILLDQEQLSEAQRRFCQKIRDSALQLQTSLNQLVDLSRIEGGQTELFLQEFQLDDTLRDSCAALARPAQMRQVQLEYRLAPGVTTVVSDQGKLRQVLYSFLGWAISRSSAGQRVSVLADINEDSFLRLSIDDSGGPVADLSRVFEPDPSASGGEADMYGLGIIIGHRLLEVMNGAVTLQNRAGGGLRVVIELPAGPLKR